MANTKAAASLPLVFLFFMFLAFNPGGTLKIVNGQAKTWCVAREMAPANDLQGVIDYVCGQLDCSIIKEGGLCYEPNTVNCHASTVMNIYYQSHGRSDEACRFNGNGVTTITDPSYGSCRYE